MDIRREDIRNPGEIFLIRKVHEEAFAGSEEAGLVDKLRRDGHTLLSLVAEVDARIVGHILFSRMWIDAPSRVPAVALAPLAVVPEHQRQGIGGRLVTHGLELLRIRGERIVIVLGHPGFYSSFGFSAEKTRRLEHPFSPAAFMALELVQGALEGIQGKVVYPPPFGISQGS